MILSHSRRFIFVKTRKVGGTSLEIALSKFCGPEDILTPLSEGEEAMRLSVSGRKGQNFHKSLARWSVKDHARFAIKGRRPNAFIPHSSAEEIRTRIGQTLWDSYFTFSVVRNPYDRTISAYFWEIHNAAPGDPIKTMDFMTWLHERPTSVVTNWDMITLDGAVGVDFAVRYEHLQEDLAALAQRLGITEDLHALLRGQRAKSGIRAKNATPAEFLAQYPEAIDYIAQTARREIETFGYECPRL